MSIAEKNAKERLEFLEYVDYLAQIKREVVIQIGSDGVRDFDTNFMFVWLHDLEERGLIEKFQYPSPVPSGISDENVGKLFKFKVKDGLHDYIDEAYRYWNLSIENLSKNNFVAVFDLAYEMFHKYEITQSNKIDVAVKANIRRFPQLDDDYIDYRANAVQFLREYGTIKSVSDNGIVFTVTVERRYFDRTYQHIMTRALQEGLVTYAKDPTATKALAEESKRLQTKSQSDEEKPKVKTAIEKDKEKIKRSLELSERFRKTLNFYLNVTDNKQSVIQIYTNDFIYNGLTFSQAKKLVFEHEDKGYYKVISVPKTSKKDDIFVIEFADSHLKWLRELEEDTEYWQNLELIAKFVSRMCNVYDTFFQDKSAVHEDEQLNTLYVMLVIKIDRILAKDKFAYLRTLRPKLHDSFMGKANEVALEYTDEFRSKIWRFYDEVNRVAAEITIDTGGFIIDEYEVKFLEEVDKAIEQHKKVSRAAAYSWHKKGDKFAQGKVIIDKESKPKPDYPDDTASVRDEEPTKPDIQKNMSSEPKTQPNKVLFDIRTSTLSYGKKDCLIPDESLEHYVCKLVFKNRRVAAKETDILDAAGVGQDSRRPVYDARLRVNTKVKKQLGIDKLLTYRAAKVRIDKKYR